VEIYSRCYAMRAESPVEVWQVGRAVKDDRQVGPSLPMAVA